MGRIVVAGHVCLDIIPDFGKAVKPLMEIFVPGTLTEIGRATVATGGAVSNTGIALHRLGLDVSLMAKVGDDEFGHSILNILAQYGEGPVSGMIMDPAVESSYSIVINPPGIDRVFLHCPGANHTFCAEDIEYEKLEGVDLFHFGYPTLMRSMYRDAGAEMKEIFERVRGKGVLTSLDMTRPDPAAESGKVDWLAWLRNVLPKVDIFLPSIDEILYMLNRPKYEALAAEFGEDNLMAGIDCATVREVAQRLLDLGVSVVVIKLGDQGLYLRTADGVPGRGPVWSNADIFAPCYQAAVVGTTGSGDCTIAGFLAGFVKGGTPQDAMNSAVGVGACSTESAEATGAVPHWDEVQRRITAGWGRLASKFID